MRLSDIKGDKAFEVLADLMDPLKVIATDTDVREASKESYMASIQVALRKYPKEFTKILALLDLKDPKTYEVTLGMLPAKVFEVMNDPDLKVLFQSQSQEDTSFGSATETTEENKK